jgi:hypothetical protein
MAVALNPDRINLHFDQYEIERPVKESPFLKQTPVVLSDLADKDLDSTMILFIPIRHLDALSAENRIMKINI